MPAYIVTADQSAATRRIDGVDTMIVFATSTTQAKEICKARYTGDADEVWDAATVTEVVAATNWIGWVFRAQLFDTDGTVVLDYSLTATGAPQDTIDEIAAVMVTGINAASDLIANASYNSTSNTLTVAGAADNLGDHRLVFTIKPPADQNLGDVNIASLVGTVTDEGATGAAVTVVLPADAAVIPQVMALATRVA